jgi:uncharacterized membrane protein YfcA
MLLEALGISLLMMVATGFSTVSGFGTSTISIPILLFFFPLPETLLFVGMMRMIGTFWKLFLFRGQVLLRARQIFSIVFFIGLSSVIASILGAWTLLTYVEQISKRFLGIILLIYVIFIFVRPRFKLAPNKLVSVPGGALAGFSAGIFGISGPIQSAVLSIFDLPKVTYIVVAASLDAIIDTSRLTFYLMGGTALLPVFVLGLVFSIPAIFLGTTLARNILYRIPQRYFRIVIILLLGIISLRWIIWG